MAFSQPARNRLDQLLNAISRDVVSYDRMRSFVVLLAQQMHVDGAPIDEAETEIADVLRANGALPAETCRNLVAEYRKERDRLSAGDGR